jgi:hypothetical protein
MTEALLNCPFCGGEAVIDGKSEDVRVRCEYCHSVGRPFDFGIDADEEAIDRAEASAVGAWNRRTPSALLDAVRNLIAVKGRHHSELAYNRLVAAYDAMQPAKEE